MAKRRMAKLCAAITFSSGLLLTSAAFTSTTQDPRALSESQVRCNSAVTNKQETIPLVTDDQALFGGANLDSPRGLWLAKRKPKCGNGILEDGEICEIDDSGPSCAALGIGANTDPLPCNSTCSGWDTETCQQ